jgi:replicative DNA helicase
MNPTNKINVKANIPPNAIETEKYILGVLINTQSYLPEELTPGLFYDPKHQDIATALLSLKARNIQVDLRTAPLEYLRLYPNGDLPYCNELETIAQNIPYNPEWTKIIIEKAKLRKIKSLTKSIGDYINEDTASSDHIVLTLEQELKSLTVKKDNQVDAVPMSTDLMKTFNRKEDPNCVIGNRWLCKGGSMLLVSQSGVGKSSFALQFLISLCIKRPFFGIEAKRPLRVVMLQAENDFGDVAEAYQDITAGMYLDEEQKELLDQNLIIYRNKNSVGDDFIELMRNLIIKHNADVFLCDPLLSFAGIQLSDQQQMTEFLRHKVDKVLDETGCIMVAVHHTTKPKSAKDKEGQTIADLAYSGAGASELVNWVREVGVLVRYEGTNPIFKFSLTKRRGRAGMRDHTGEFAGDVTVRHSRQPGIIRWELASPDEANDGTEEDTKSSTGSRSKTKSGSGHSDSSNAKGSTSRLNVAG